MFDKARIARLDLLTRATLGVAALVCLTVPLYTKITLDLTDTALPVLVILIMAAIAIIYGKWRGAPRLSAGAAMCADLVAASLVLGTASYLAAAAGRPMAAAQFAAMDQAMGFDWKAYTGFIEARPWLKNTLFAAYMTMALQLGILVVYFAIRGRLDWLRLTLNTFILAAIITIAISALLPAVDADVTFGKYQAVMTAQGWSTGGLRANHFLNLHDGFMTRIPVMEATGIVTFPSFHTVCGVLFTICFAQIRFCLWPAAIVNALLIAATPIEGGHYAVDALAGTALCLIVFVALRTYASAPAAQAAPALAPAE